MIYIYVGRDNDNWVKFKVTRWISAATAATRMLLQREGERMELSQDGILPYHPLITQGLQ